MPAPKRTPSGSKKPPLRAAPIRYPDHPRCRPPRAAGAYGPVRMLNDRGRWVQDTGAPGLVFLAPAAADLDDAVLWIATCACTTLRTCPLARGLSFANDGTYSMTSIVRRRRVDPAR